MSVVQSMASWIAYAIAGAFLSESWAAPVAAIVACAVIAAASRAGRRGDELVIELASAVFFGGYTAIAWASHNSADAARWVGPASQLWLATVVAAGLVRHRPFTLPIARRSAPEQVHATEWFYRFNVRLSRAWLLSFLASGLVLAVAAWMHESHVWLNVVCILAAIAAPTVYTRRVIQQTRATKGA